VLEYEISIKLFASPECVHLVVVEVVVVVVVGGGGLRASMTLRAMPVGTYVPGRASQGGQAVREQPD